MDVFLGTLVLEPSLTGIGLLVLDPLEDMFQGCMHQLVVEFMSLPEAAVTVLVEFM